jgi:ribosome recycling factor
MKENFKLDYKKGLENAVQNIESDRAAISAVLTDVMIYLKKNEENHKGAGHIAAKYFEALQRSNDQLIKLLTLQERRERQEDDSLSPDELYDLIDKQEDEG